MDKDSYRKHIDSVLTWIEVNDDLDINMAAVLTQMCNQEVKEDNDRKKAWAGIRAILGMCPNPPISQRGSNCPVRKYLTTRPDVEVAFIALHDSIGDLLFKHGKTGGGNYADSAEYAEVQLNSLLTRLRKESKEGNWAIPE